MDKYFSSDIIEKLKYYVYIYSDPDTDEIFYVGKGKGNRVFAHLNDQSNKEKMQRIQFIKEKGKEPKIEILIHGITDESTALKVEAAVIDLLGKGKLTNKVRGWQSADFGRVELNQLISIFQKQSISITEKSILIRINQLFRYGMSDIELYDVTRGVWKLGENRNKVEYAFAIYDGIIKQVYKVEHWFPAGTTFSTRGDLSESPKSAKRWEFVGKIADQEILSKYIGKSVDHYFSKNSQSPVIYLNIEK